MEKMNYMNGVIISRVTYPELEEDIARIKDKIKLDESGYVFKTIETQSSLYYSCDQSVYYKQNEINDRYVALLKEHSRLKKRTLWQRILNK